MMYEYNKVSFYGSIKNELACKLKLNVPNPFNTIQAMWTTIQNQEEQYHTWVSFS